MCLTEVGQPEHSGKRSHHQHPSEDSGTSESEKEETEHWKGRHSAHSRDYTDSSLRSGESMSDEDDANRDGGYWKVGAKVPGLPSWITRRRTPDARVASNVWEGKQPNEGQVPCRLQDSQDLPGVHLLHKVR